MKLIHLILTLVFAVQATHAATFLESEKAKKAEAEASLKRQMQAAIVNHSRGQVQAAIGQMKKLAQLGHPEAMNLLGFWYQTGAGVERSLETASGYYSDAAAKDYPPAMVNLAKMLIGRAGATDEDQKKGVEWLMKASQLGDADAFIALAQAYAQGAGVARSLDDARNWATKAAERGNRDGYWLLYLLHSGQFGASPGNKPQEGLNALSKAADEGHEKACLQLAEMLATGAGVAQNTDVATALLTHTAERGSAEASYRLGLQAAKKGGDISIPLKHFRAAAQLGHAEAQNEYGLRLRKGKGIEADPAEAANWFKEAIRRGSEAARVNLADLYRTGIGVAKDPKQCVELATASLKNGYIPAATLLARYYLGDDEKDTARAAVLAQWALKQGDTEAAEVEKEATAAATPESLVGAGFWLKTVLPSVAGLPLVEGKK